MSALRNCIRVRATLSLGVPLAQVCSLCEVKSGVSLRIDRGLIGGWKLIGWIDRGLEVWDGTGWNGFGWGGVD